MKRKLYSIISYFISMVWALNILPVNAQSFQWAKQIESTVESNGISIASDASGNVLTAGTFVGTTDFDPGPGVFNLTATGEADNFISKLDASGNFMWAKQFGGPDFDYMRSITTDAAGNVYTTGYFTGTIDFDPGPGIFNLTCPGTTTDMFISKLDAAGNFVWAKQIEGESLGFSIFVDPSGNIYTTGQFGGTLDFDPGPGIYNLYSNLDGTIFVSKLDASGNFVWAKAMGGTNSVFSIAFSIKVDASGNVYTTGSFSGTADFDPGPGACNFTTTGMINNRDIFISKLDASGNFIWAKQIGGPGDNEYPGGVALDASGNVFIAGAFQNYMDVDPDTAIQLNLTSAGHFDAFVLKLNAAGNFQWAKNMGGISEERANYLAVDASGNVYTTGYFAGTSDFDPGPGIFNVTPGGGWDIFISKLDASGNFVWVAPLVGYNSCNGEGQYMAVDALNNLYITGYFYDMMDFDPDPIGQFDMTAIGYQVFILKLSQSLTGLMENNSSGSLDLYPNPATDFITNSWFQDYKSAKISILDVTGRSVITKELMDKKNKLDITTLAPGAYFLKVETERESWVRKFIKKDI